MIDDFIHVPLWGRLFPRPYWRRYHRRLRRWAKWYEERFGEKQQHT